MTKKKGRKVVILRGGKFPRHRGEAVAGNWVCVYQADVDMNHVKGHLRLKNPAYWSAVENDEPTEGLVPFIFLYREKGPYVFLPRHYKLQALRELTVRRVPMPPALCRQYKTKVKPRSFVQERALAAFEGKADGILCLACGQGKTKSSLMIAAAGKKFPVLVIVHTTALMDQWRKEIAATYEISEEEVGIIRGPKCEWQGRSISIAMLQSLAARKYTKEFHAYWRLIITDECHRMGGFTWSTVIHRFPGQRIGLSATPTRPDGMDVAFRVHMGKVRYQYTKQTLSSEFVFVHTGINVPTPHMRNPMHRLAKVMSWVSKCDERNDIIASFLRKAYKEGRKVITLGDRVETLETLCRGYPGTSKAVFVGKTKQGDERKEALSKDAIFATSSMAKEGLDVPRLDTLFITIPFSGEGRLEQSVGRILRECEGKMPPVTYVFVDRQPSLQKFAAVQKNWAERKGYKVTELFPGEY